MLKKLLALTAAAVMIFLMTPVAPAHAHGEAAQESFLRMGTVAFWDVKFTTEKVEQGQALTITGTAKVLETWPESMADPEEGFIGVLAPGPVVVLTERTVNGKPAPDAIEIEKGGVYQFSMTVVGRRVGHWHVHPIFGVHGAGTLIGPGQYIDVSESEDGFTNNITLDNGDEVNLETLGMGGLWFWTILWFVVGFAWLIYWTVPKRTVTRLPVTSQIPLNTDGMAYGLITKKDHRWMNIMTAFTLVAVVGGMVYQAVAYPAKMPLQVLRYAPPPADLDDQFANVSADSAVYDVDNTEVELKVKITNTGDTPVSVEQFTTTTLTWTASDEPGPGNLVVSAPTIAPGKTATIELDMADPAWKTERLMPVGESRLQLTGVVRLKDGAGHENFATVQTFVSPTKIGGEKVTES
jgi:methane/ammonia monooxygenase subunit B